MFPLIGFLSCHGLQAVAKTNMQGALAKITKSKAH